MLNNLGTIISTFLFGKKIGEDNFGNIYYLNKNNKRWVLYYKNNDASSVPPEWQAWLTYTVNDLPNKKDKKKKWQIKHEPNKTGLNYIMKKNKQEKKEEISSYNSWKPNKREN